MTLVPLLRATWLGRRVACSSYGSGQHSLQVQLARLASRARSRSRDHGVAADLPRLRLRWRLLTAGRRPEHENVFLAAALLARGYDARLVVGREIAPVTGPARYLSWVTVSGAVVSTGLPVTESYTPLAALPHA